MAQDIDPKIKSTLIAIAKGRAPNPHGTLANIPRHQLITMARELCVAMGWPWHNADLPPEGEEK